MSSSKNSDLERDFAAGVHLSEAPPPPPFVLGWSRNWVGSESGQIQSVKLLQNMVFNTTLHVHSTVYTPPPHPLPPTICLYLLYFDIEKGEAVTREKGRWATRESTDYKAGLKIPT
jgi:hypothetical protein